MSNTEMNKRGINPVLMKLTPGKVVKFLKK